MITNGFVRLMSFAVLVAGLAISGCGGGGRAPVFPTSGQLFIKDKPAANVFVLFEPVGGNESSLRPSATTDLEGKFRLTTYEAFDGAPAGDYTVTLLYEPVNSPLNRPKGKPPSVPLAYQKAATSPLKATVEAKPTNEIAAFKVH